MLRIGFILAKGGTVSFAVTCAMVAAASAATVVTTTVTYQYNDDGAPTAITTQVGSAAATIEYLTWDNFVPDADDPTGGTVTAANGNLLGVGSTPGSDSTEFSFDRRNRLVGYGAVTYAYHPDGRIQSASLSDDGWTFYHDANATRRIANVCQVSSDECSGWLGEVRHLSAGSDDALLVPRKDVLASYDPSGDALTPYDFDAYGSDLEASTSSTYDIADNPFRYAGELRDPVSGAYYLRARWYAPDLPSFVARDPLAHLNRYGYAAGNPVMNVDPTGMRSRSIFESLDDALRKGVEWLDSGVQGHLARLFLAPAMGVLEIAANPKSFWESLKHNYEGSDVYFALGIAGQIAGGGLFPIGAEATTVIGYGERALSVSQTITTSFRRGKLDANELLESSEELIGSLAYERAFEGARESREIKGHSIEANLDPWSRATKMANAAREAVDRVRISTRHHARLDRAKRARAAARAASVADDDTIPGRLRSRVRRRPAFPLDLEAVDQPDAWEISRVARDSRAILPQHAPGPRFASAAAAPLANDCRQSVRDVLRLLEGF